MTVAVEKTAALNMFFTLVWEFLSSVLILKKRKKEKRNPPVYSRLVIYTSKPVGAENIKYASDRCCGKVDPLVIITERRKCHIVTGWSPTDVAFCVAFCLKVGYKIGLNLCEAELFK